MFSLILHVFYTFSRLYFCPLCMFDVILTQVTGMYSSSLVHGCLKFAKSESSLFTKAINAVLCDKESELSYLFNEESHNCLSKLSIYLFHYGSLENYARKSSGVSG